MSNGHIFISYRRDDSAGYARAIYDQFVQLFSRERVFMDVDAIEPGHPFDEAIERAVGQCEILLAVIGGRWLGQQASTSPRINDPKDYVRLEIGAALSRNIRVVPVLLDGASMPTEEELPEPLRALARRNAIEVSNSRFKSDVDRLIESVRKALGESGAPMQKVYWIVGALAAGALSLILYFQFPSFDRNRPAQAVLGADNQTSDPKVEPRSESTISFPTLLQGSLQKKEEETTAPPDELKPELVAGALFQDDFERDQLGKLYEVVNPDPNRLAVAEGQLLIVAGPRDQEGVPNNLVLVRQKFAGNFTATIRLTMQVTKGNAVTMRYWVDSKNGLILGIYGFQATGADETEGRHIGFIKILNGKSNNICQFYSQPRWSYLGSLGGRQLLGYATEPELWYLQLKRKGVKYTGRVSIDGVEWQEVGTHTILSKDGRVGFTARAGEGIENPAEFDDFVVKGAQ